MAPKVFFLLWKDLVLRKNHLIETIVEVIFPIVMVACANFFLDATGFASVGNGAYYGVFHDGDCELTTAIKGNVMYEPLTAFTNDIMTKAACYAGLNRSYLKTGKLNENKSNFTIGVKFHIPSDADDPPKILNYELFPTKDIWNSKKSDFPFFDQEYYNSDAMDIIQLQRGIDAAFLDKMGVTGHRIRLERNSAGLSLYYLWAIYFILFFALTFMVSPIVSRIVSEKYSGSKEMMLMMGVSRWELWLSKSLDILLFDMIVVSGMVLFLYVPLKPTSSHLTQDPLLFWCITMYGVIAVMCFLFFLSSIFTIPVVATFVTQVFWVFAFFFSTIVFAAFKVAYYISVLLCLLPHIALMKAVILLLKFDHFHIKLNLSEVISEKDKITLKMILIMLSVDIVMYLILAIYVDRLRPGRYGVPEPFYFMFKKSFWKSPKHQVVTTISETQSVENFEAVPRGLKVGVSVKNVSKKYRLPKRRVKMAVDNVSIDFYHGEISGLLGHNGAGKTTLFSIISGLTYPSSGKISINGHDLASDTTKARKSLGLCPQFDLLFDDLTTVQIITFYGLIKGLSLSDAGREADKLIDVLKLSRVRSTKTCKLSGGQRRKVSLAIALVGGSEVLLLDEPSSGMDPEIRREIWQILLLLRGERTMILTTHFMEEADALCDRIAIMDHGKIRCYGSPMYLKSKFGKGYILSVVVLSTDKSKSVVNYVKQTAGAKFKSQNVRTLTFEIPDKDVKVFPTLFAGLEDKQKNREIASYTVSFSALEDVFFRFSKEMQDETEPNVETPDKNTGRGDGVVLKRRGPFFFFIHLWALLIKKAIIFRKEVFIFLTFCVFASVFLIFVVVINNQNEEEETGFFFFGNYRPPKEDEDSGSDYGEDGDGDDDDADGNKDKKLKNEIEAKISRVLSPSALVLISNKTEETRKKKLKELFKSFNTHYLEVSDVPKAVEEHMNDNFFKLSEKNILGVDYTPEEVTLYYSDRVMHGVPTPFNFIHNLLLNSENSDGKILTKLSDEYADKPREEPRRGLLTFGVPCTLRLQTDLSGIQTFYYLVGPLNEKLSGAKGIQLMLTSVALYWLSHLIFDFFTFLVFISLIYIGLAYSTKDKFLFNNVGFAFGVLLTWGCGLILLSYAITIDVRSTTTAFTIQIVIYCIFVFFVYNLILLRFISMSYKFLHPNVIAKIGFNDACMANQTFVILELLAYDVILFFYLILRDSGCVTRMFNSLINLVRCGPTGSYGESKDEYVVAEEELVRKAVVERTGTALIADNLKRWFFRRFRCFPAVAGVSFIVRKGECFGLLGVNGAGKTTTFNMLTATLPPSEGSVYICTRRLNIFNRQQLLYSVGYCPQFGGLIHAFKGKELLKFFARLKGVEGRKIKPEVEKWIQKVNLMEYESQKCGQYSGGNQRKLSTAIALVGNPLLVFLDEPTSGVDPAARRAIWSAIEEVQNQGQSIVLTSHSMDECEALCTRLGIMVDGKFRCIGEITTIKNRFGQGYCIELKLTVDFNEKNVESLKKAVKNAFDPGCELVDQHLTVLQYFIKNKNISWSDVFSKLQTLKSNHSIIESYSASSTTLEQVFIHFAKNK